VTLRANHDTRVELFGCCYPEKERERERERERLAFAQHKILEEVIGEAGLGYSKCPMKKLPRGDSRRLCSETSRRTLHHSSLLLFYFSARIYFAGFTVSTLRVRTRAPHTSGRTIECVNNTHGGASVSAVYFIARDSPRLLSLPPRSAASRTINCVNKKLRCSSITVKSAN